MSTPGLTISGRGSTTPPDFCKSLQIQGHRGLVGRWLVASTKSKWTDHPSVTGIVEAVTCR